MSDTGWKSPGTVVNDNSVGTVAWSNPDNAKAGDDSYASVLEYINTIDTHYLKATNFGFSIPTGNVISGIEVRVEKRATSDDGYSWAVDNKVKLALPTTGEGSGDKANTTTHYPTSDSYITYGGSSDKWNESLTYSTINSSDFGILFSSHLIIDHSMSVYVDHIQIKVYYTELGPVVGQKYALPPFRRS